MESTVLRQVKEKVDYSWEKNPGVKRLLDVIASTIAQEFVEVVKKNSQVFQEDPR